MRFIIDENGVLTSVKGITKNDFTIIIPEGVKVIDSACFFKKNIKEVIMPNTVEKIGLCAFQDCTKLEKITLSNNIKIIDLYAFDNCKNLKEIKFPSTLSSIACCVLSNCINLEKIYIPKYVRSIHESAFDLDKNIKEIIIGNNALLFADAIKKILRVNNQCYINSNTNELLLTSREIDNKNYRKIDYEEHKKILKCNTGEAIVIAVSYDIEQFKKIDSLKNILIDIIKEIYEEENYKEMIDSLLNIKEFNHLLERLQKKVKIDTTRLYNLFKLSYSLGAFSDNYIERQKACEFLMNCFEKNYITIKDLALFNKLNMKKFNSEWSQLFMENVKDIFELEREKPSIITKIYNNFDDIKEFGRSNKGSQRFRKVTFDMCKEYCSKINFENVDETNVDISVALSKFTRKQEAFDSAKDIRQKYLNLKREGNITDHILEKEIKEDIFSKIENERQNIVESIKITLNNLNDISENTFSYEFLSKYDPDNFVLGKYCSCCAHINGIGQKIVEESILNPNCQNLIIRDRFGKIISKSTLYINKNQGYGVFNTIEINEKYRDLKSRKLIFDKYNQAIERFVLEYNDLHPNKPLRKITVGMKSNKLENELRKNNKRSNIILRAVDFSYDNGFVCSWDDEQYVLWQKDGIKKNK